MKSFKSLIFVFISIFSIKAFSETAYGLFMIVKGEVRVIKPNNETYEAKVGSKIYPQETIISGKDSRAKIVMSDRNIINVLPETKMTIEKYVADGKDKNVRLNLQEGKVRNNVVPNSYDGENNKFEVVTPTAVAGVRGTQFITSFEKSTQMTQLITLKGQVAFQSFDSKTNKASEPVIVQKGETSQTSSGAAPPAPPVKVNTNEIKHLENETSVKKTPDQPEPIGDKRMPPPPPPPNDMTPINNVAPRRDNLLDDTNKQILNRPAKVKVVPE